MSLFRGFTLFEVLIALMIASIGMLAICRLEHLAWSLLTDPQVPYCESIGHL